MLDLPVTICASCGRPIERRPLWVFSVTARVPVAEGHRLGPGFVPVHLTCATYIEPVRR